MTIDLNRDIIAFSLAYTLLT